MKKSLILLSVVLILLVLTVTSCKKDSTPPVSDNFVGSIWIECGDDVIPTTPLTLTFTDETAFNMNMSDKLHTGTYTKRNNTVYMVFDDSLNGWRWVGVINKGIMTIPLEGTSHTLVFIRQ